MDNQKYLNVEMRVMFNVPVDEDFDIDELSEEESALLNNIEKEVNLFKMKNGIGQEKNECIDI